ncbi:MAG: hypothetical protein NTZ73_00815 [Candidatus Diapherotrites archaeon]|nr:hypothetical protein [Candidatus Diapherotrites archaeon]
MQNLSFLKPMLVEAEGKISLAVLNKKQLKDSVKNIIHYYSKNMGRSSVLISLSIPIEQFSHAEEFSGIAKDKLVFIDMCSGKKGKTTVDGFKTFFIENPSDLTSLRIILENILPKAGEGGAERKLVLFESISALSAYVERKVLDKFIYYLNNKLSFDGNTGILLSVKGSGVEGEIEIIKQLCSKFYDFSEVATIEVEKME